MEAVGIKEYEGWKSENILVLTYPCETKIAYLDVDKVGPTVAGVIKKLHGKKPIKAEIFGKDWRVTAPELLYKWLLKVLHPIKYDIVYYSDDLSSEYLFKDGVHQENVRIDGNCKRHPRIPKKGDWCWFWNKYDDIPCLNQLDYIENDFYYSDTENPINYEQNFQYEFCEPYIGKLPTVIRSK